MPPILGPKGDTPTDEVEFQDEATEEVEAEQPVGFDTQWEVMSRDKKPCTHTPQRHDGSNMDKRGPRGTSHRPKPRVTDWSRKIAAKLSQRFIR